MRIRKAFARLNSKGFSLTEMLLAVLILLMVTSVAAGGIPAAMRAYQNIVEAANAQVLLSTTMTRLRYELGKAKYLKSDSQTQITFRNMEGSMSLLRLQEAGDSDGPGIYIVRYQYDNGTESAGEPQLLVSKQAANGTLHVTYTSVVPSTDKATVQFSGLSVKNEQGKTLASESLTIRTMADLFG